MRPTLTHIALMVRDIDASTEFYRRYCGMKPVHDRGSDQERTVWLAEPGREGVLVFVLIRGDARPPQGAGDYSHFGFALESRAAVSALAARAREEHCLMWEPREDPPPVGYYCGVRDPDGNVVQLRSAAWPRRTS